MSAQMTASTPSRTPGAARPLRVYVACPGVDRVRRGFERFAVDAVDALAPLDALDVKLVKGAGPRRPGEIVVPSVGRGSPVARNLARVMKDPRPDIPGVREYIVEEASFALALTPLLWRDRPDVVFTSDPHVGRALIRLRRALPRSLRLVFSNSAPLHPPYAGWDHVQHSNNETYTETLATGAAPWRHTELNLAVSLPGQPPPALRDADRLALRERLDLPTSAPILLSVGAMNAFHKRMDYVIDEVAAMDAPRPHLVILGDASRGKDIVRLARAQLGPSGATLRTVPSDEVVAYYDAADVFILASRNEGFGLAYVEALARGLTCIAHDRPHTRRLFGEHAVLTDLTVPGNGRRAILQALAHPPTPAERARRFDHAYESFSWARIAPRYQDMLMRAAAAPAWTP